MHVSVCHDAKCASSGAIRRGEGFYTDLRTVCRRFDKLIRRLPLYLQYNIRELMKKAVYRKMLDKSVIHAVMSHLGFYFCDSIIVRCNTCRPVSASLASILQIWMTLPAVSTITYRLTRCALVDLKALLPRIDTDILGDLRITMLACTAAVHPEPEGVQSSPYLASLVGQLKSHSNLLRSLSICLSSTNANQAAGLAMFNILDVDFPRLATLKITLPQQRQNREHRLFCDLTCHILESSPGLVELDLQCPFPANLLQRLLVGIRKSGIKTLVLRTLHHVDFRHVDGGRSVHMVIAMLRSHNKTIVTSLGFATVPWEIVRDIPAWIPSLQLFSTDVKETRELCKQLHDLDSLPGLRHLQITARKHRSWTGGYRLARRLLNLCEARAVQVTLLPADWHRAPEESDVLDSDACETMQQLFRCDAETAAPPLSEEHVVQQP